MTDLKTAKAAERPLLRAMFAVHAATLARQGNLLIEVPRLIQRGRTRTECEAISASPHAFRWPAPCSMNCSTTATRGGNSVADAPQHVLLLACTAGECVHMPTVSPASIVQ